MPTLLHIVDVYMHSFLHIVVYTHVYCVGLFHRFKLFCNFVALIARPI